MSGARAGKRARKTVAPAQKPAIGSLIDDLIIAISLVDVATHAMECQEIGSPEQVVLKRALKSLWTVHDGLSALH